MRTIVRSYCAYPCFWQGVDPDGDLDGVLRPKRSTRTPWITCTPLNEAAYQGELGVCHFIYEHGAADTVRTKNSDG